MSKTIEPAPFLSEFDREYLIARGKNPDDYIIETTEENEDEIPPYSEWKVEALQREIADRNAERDDDEQIVATDSRKKADLIAALEDDDLRA